MRRALAPLVALSAAVVLASCTSTAASHPTTTTSNVGSSSTTTPSSASSGGSSARAASILRTALTNGRAERSLHYVSVSTQGSVHVTITGDVTKSDGIQTIVYDHGSAHGSVVVELVGREAWFRGDAVALFNFMGLSKAASNTYAGKWISVVSSDSAFGQTAAALTVSSVLGEIGLGAPLKEGGTARISGTPVLQISGALAGSTAGSGAKGTASLEVTLSTTTPLPVRFSGAEQGSSGHFVESLGLSRWGEAVHVTAPSSAVPLATITGPPTTAPQPTTLV